MNTKNPLMQLWFVKFCSRTSADQVVFTFTLSLESTEAEAFAHGFTFIAPDYRADYREAEATRICRTRDQVLCFEPC